MTRRLIEVEEIRHLSEGRQHKWGLDVGDVWNIVDVLLAAHDAERDRVRKADQALVTLRTAAHDFVEVTNIFLASTNDSPEKGRAHLKLVEADLNLAGALRADPDVLAGWLRADVLLEASTKARDHSVNAPYTLWAHVADWLHDLAMKAKEP